MTIDEIADRIKNQRQLEQLEQKPATPYDPSDAMDNLEEAKQYIRFLYAQVQDYKETMKRMQDSLDEIKAELKVARETANAELKVARETAKAESESKAKLMESFVALSGELKDANTRIQELTRQLETKNNRLKVLSKDYFGTSKSQKGIETKPEPKGKNDDREDFDGTNPPSDTPSDTNATGVQEKNEGIYHGPDRTGWKYSKQTVGNPITHECDRSKLPEGTVILKVLNPKVVRDITCSIQEHHFERLKVRYPDGTVKVVYLPYDKDEQAHIYNEVVPGTGVTANLLSYLLFNRYQMATPAYREAKNRLADMDWNTCRQNLLNWADKGAVQLNKLIPALKAVALQKGANVNVDETWCRYQTHFGHKKNYMWCLANRKAGIVIFFYEDTIDAEGKQHSGGRSRSVLKDFLGDAEIKSLQSDGYNVYMYLDGELMDVEHLCCLAHARAKMKYAYDQGCEKARYFLEQIGKLYKREEQYRTSHNTASQIKTKRNDTYTNNIVDGMRKKLLQLLSEGEAQVSDLMWRALNYLYRFWDNIFAYRNDGEYTIDNLAAERAIRPMTVQRKNSLFYCSTKGAKNAALYNTFIETCKQAGISFREYFRQVILALKSGRTDYDNLLPMTIALKI